MNEENMIHLYKGYYSVIKNMEKLPFTPIWMALEGIMWSEISQPENEKYCMISFLCETQNQTNKSKTKNKFIETKDCWLPEGGICERWGKTVKVA